jgi:predicted transposase YbfD/YdcC
MSRTARRARPLRLKYIRGLAGHPGVKEGCKVPKPEENWLKPFKDLPDPRRVQGTYHPLMTIVGIALLAVLCGANTCSEIEAYGKEKEAWLKQFLDLRCGVPSLDTIERVIARIDPEWFEVGFRRWIAQIIKPLGIEVVRLDGKAHRGSYDTGAGLKALHTVSAWSSEHRLVLGEVAVASKSNEITAIPVLLELLNLKGAVVTIDAMGTQKDIVRLIRAKDADYLLPIKANHPTLYQELEVWVRITQVTAWQGILYQTTATMETRHGRHEQRQLWAIPLSQIDPTSRLHSQLAPWQDARTLVVLWRRRRTSKKETTELHFYLTSLDPDAVRLMELIRSHWSIENQLHWSLDVVFQEDACRTRKGHGPRNLGLLRRLALSLLHQESSYPASLKRKRYRALLNNDYLCSILSAAMA